MRHDPIERAISLLNEARSLLEETADLDLQEAADDIGPILLAVEDWQRREQH